MSMGIACTIGLPLVGFISVRHGPDTVLIVVGCLFLPQVVMCALATPLTKVATPIRVAHQWGGMFERLRAHPDLRRASDLCVGWDHARSCGNRRRR